jgi:hypothetical protein
MLVVQVNDQQSDLIFTLLIGVITKRITVSDIYFKKTDFRINDGVHSFY